MGNETIACATCGGTGVIYPLADRDRARMCLGCDGTGFVPDTDTPTEDALESAIARIAELTAALQPFAKAHNDYEYLLANMAGSQEDDFMRWIDYVNRYFDDESSAACFKRAADALDGTITIVDDEGRWER